MEHAIVAILIVAIVLTGVLVAAQSGFSSADLVAQTWKATEVRAADIARTSIHATQVTWSSGYVQVTIVNNGDVPLGDFAHWDVILQYYDQQVGYHILWVPFVTGTSPGSNQWAVAGIYYNGQPEVYEPGILDPGEQIVVRIKPSLAIGRHTTNYVEVSTQNGVSTSIQLGT